MKFVAFILICLAGVCARAQTTVTLAWTGYGNQNYEVFWATDLNTLTATVNGGGYGIACGTNWSVTISNLPNTQCFFQVRAVGPASTASNVAQKIASISSTNAPVAPVKTVLPKPVVTTNLPPKPFSNAPAPGLPP